MTSYETWLKKEEEWIGVYCKKIRRRSLCMVVPLTLVLCTAVIGGLAMIGGSGMEDAGYSALGGFLAGFFVCAVYLAVLLPAMNPRRYGRKIDKNVRDLGCSESEKELLAREMLEAKENQKISYTITGPGSKGTPGRFVRTPHFAFLVGSTPYSILVRLSDIAEIRQGQEKKTAARRGGNTRRMYFFTLYTIGFYRRDRLQRGLTERDLPDEAFGFFDAGIRGQVLELLKESGIRIS